MIEDCTHDEFLGGKVRALQPRKGYRAGVDAVLLASAVEAQPGQSVLELGIGVGVASLCLNERVPGLTLTGVELQADYAELCRKNALACAADLQVEQADIRMLPDTIRLQQYDHVLMNPPYFERSKGDKSTDAGRDIAMAGATELNDWIDVAAKRLAPKGYMTVIQRIERLPEVLSSTGGRLGSIQMRPITARSGRSPGLFLLRARHSGKAPFQMLAPLVMHEGAEHTGDAESYTPLVRAILRDGAQLSWTD